ncbi:MAG TPA: NYN domain-containing protein [Candidatus Polarisedimenticolaceae bacterium]|nr:NYN domain-containing protein [Candidatus Polarisedimenticolaceae bacterium]
MPYLVDGDNLLGSWPGRRRSDAERRALGVELQRLAHHWRRRITAVFDGRAPTALSAGGGVRFAGPGQSADQVILALLRAESDPAGWVVVTSDRSLGDQCRYLGARVERCDRFRQRMAARAEQEKPDRVDDLDEWLELFDDDREEPGGRD